ncbi:hypothetical protein F7725_010622 [Dissostichus mawsoni]|uniref:Follistatin-like domain-containing protein n=1 Tax=Dissostichus mawsoni TaxID=36200 RepID=A0A7J5XP44_DISMA|nr:hypothetical protein F7725_010622 [Dissostichus mawsoni]
MKRKIWLNQIQELNHDYMEVVNVLQLCRYTWHEDTFKMKVWIAFFLCLAGHAMAAPTEEAVVEELIAEEPIAEIEIGEFDEAIDIFEEEQAFADNPCLDHHCKKGKVCEVDEDNTPMCVCQDPSSCPAAEGEFEHTSTLPGLRAERVPSEDERLAEERSGYSVRARRGEQPADREAEAQVKKIFENEKRLTAGEHSLDLLAHDFEKNYNMYIFPVHWQYLTHSELSPLRAPLIPMEHCTTRFFEECDADSDKYIALEEWSNCFGIKEQDVDKDLIV